MSVVIKQNGMYALIWVFPKIGVPPHDKTPLDAVKRSTPSSHLYLEEGQIQPISVRLKKYLLELGIELLKALVCQFGSDGWFGRPFCEARIPGWDFNIVGCSMLLLYTISRWSMIQKITNLQCNYQLITCYLWSPTCQLKLFEVTIESFN